MEKDPIFDQLNDDADRDKFFRFDREIKNIRSQILQDARAEIFYEMDNDEFPVANRRASEKATFYYISSGNITKISELLQQTDLNSHPANVTEKVKEGDISETPRLQALSLFISAVTLFTRAAVDGGLPEAVAYSLSDCYIRHTLDITDSRRITSLINSAMYDFTYEVYKYHYRDCSPLVRKCCEYISGHLHDEITLADLSRLTGKSNNYISDTFARELGIRPTAYIRNVKLDYAKHALEMGNISVTALSDLLAFPSTSSFISYFKEKYGMTPSKYSRSHS